MKLVKCKYCGVPSDTTEMLQYPTKDRDGNVKLKKNGEPQTYWGHEACKLKTETENKAWSQLYEYLKNTYYIKDVPVLVIKRLKELRVNYSYQDMYHTFKSIESNIKGIEVVDGNHLNNMLIWMLKNNIESYIKEQNKILMESVTTSSVMSIVKSNKKQTDDEIENYDIL